MIARRKAIISLVVNFLVQWGLSILFWMGIHHAHAMVIWLAPIAPPYYGLLFLAPLDLDMAVVSLVISILAIGICSLAMLKPSITTLIPAHVMLVVYWLWSLALIGIGV